MSCFCYLDKISSFSHTLPKNIGAKSDSLPKDCRWIQSDPIRPSLRSKVGPANLANAVRSKNTCKACAFGTGGQKGGYLTSTVIVWRYAIKISRRRQVILNPDSIRNFRHNTIEELNQLSGKQLTDLGRLGAPLYKAPGEDRYRVLSYSQALNKISKAMKEASPERTFLWVGALFK